MKLTLTTQRDLEIIIKEYFAKFIDFVPDTPLRNEDEQYLKNLISNVGYMLKRRFSSLETSEVEDVMQRGIEGEFDNTLRLLTVPKIFKWFQGYTEKDRKRRMLENEQTRYRHKSEEQDPNWRPPATSRGAACTFILMARFGDVTGWFKTNKFENLRDSDIEFILDNLSDGSIKDWVIDKMKLA